MKTTNPNMEQRVFFSNNFRSPNNMLGRDFSPQKTTLLGSELGF